MKNPILILKFEIDINQIEEIEIHTFKELKQKIFKLFEEHQIQDDQLKYNALYRAYSCLPDSYKNTLTANEHKKMNKYRLKPKAYLDICQKDLKKKAIDKKKINQCKSSKGIKKKPIQNLLKQKQPSNIKNLKLLQSPPIYKNLFKNNDSLITIEQNFSQVKRKLTQKKRYKNKQKFDSNSFHHEIQKNRYFQSNKKIGSNLTKNRPSFKKSFIQQTNIGKALSRNNSSTKMKKSQSSKLHFQQVRSKKKIDTLKSQNIYQKKRYEIKKQQSRNQSFCEQTGKIDARKLFQNLDAQNLGYIGASNLELRNISSIELKFIQNILIVIYKTPNKIYKFDEFLKLVNETEINQYPIQTIF